MQERSPREIQKYLAQPFAPEDLEWRLQNTIEEKMRGLAVPYVTNRAIQNRLDEVCGPENWYNDFKPWHTAGKKEAQLCGIAIYFSARKEWITKWDGAEDSDIEPVKGGLSDSMKRAAVQWGIGRILYSMDAVWVDIEKRGKSYVIKDGERSKLDNAYMTALKKLNLTPAGASGIQSLLTPKVLPEQNVSAAEPPSAGTLGNGQRANPAPPVLRPSAQRQASAPAPQPPQPMPFQAPPVKADFYTVRESKVQGGMNGSNTLVTLDTPNNKQLYAFARGVRPELKSGTRLFNVKLVTKTQDTVVFYVLESYAVYPQTEGAA